MKTKNIAASKLFYLFLSVFLGTFSIIKPQNNIETLQSKIAALRDDSKILERQRNQLRKKLFANLPDRPEIQELKASISNLGKKKGGVSSNRTKTRNQLVKLMGTHHSTIPGLKQKLVRFNNTLIKMDRKKHNLEGQLDKLYATKELQKLNNKLTELGNTIKKHEIQLDTILMKA